MAQAIADLPLASVLVGQGAAMATVGVLASTINVVADERPWASLAAVVAGTAAAVAVARPLARRSYRRIYDQLLVVPGVAHRTAATAVLVGVLQAVAGLAAGSVVLAVESLLFNETAISGVAGPCALAFACLSVLSRRDLISWQERHGIVVCTRVGAPWIAVTPAQARARLVATPTSPASAKSLHDDPA